MDCEVKNHRVGVSRDRLDKNLGFDSPHAHHFYIFKMKRVFDLTFSLLSLVVLAPLMLSVALLIRLTSRGPCLFVQDRVGKDGKIFKIYKFRTMVLGAEDEKNNLFHLNERDGPAFKMEKDPRVTGVGFYLRKHSIDELPQLFNIVKGDMSIVGPRPSLVSEVSEYKDWHKKRFDVLPGLTCFWQVHPDRNMSFDEWMRMDIEYVEKNNFLMDLKMILLTIPVVFRGH